MLQLFVIIIEMKITDVSTESLEDIRQQIDTEIRIRRIKQHVHQELIKFYTEMVSKEPQRFYDTRRVLINQDVRIVR